MAADTATSPIAGLLDTYHRNINVLLEVKSGFIETFILYPRLVLVMQSAACHAIVALSISTNVPRLEAARSPFILTFA